MGLRMDAFLLAQSMSWLKLCRSSRFLEYLLDQRPVQLDSGDSEESHADYRGGEPHTRKTNSSQQIKPTLNRRSPRSLPGR